MLDIYKLGDDVLRQKCEKVTVFDDALDILVDAMYETMEEAEGVGLAGPQIGVSQRLFVVEVPNEGIKKTFINPQIIETSVDVGPYDEGCLSVPGIYREIIRPLSVTVCAQDTKGKPFTVTASGLFARVIQHECDHLEGKLFIDHLDEKQQEAVFAAYAKKNRHKGRKKK